MDVNDSSGLIFAGIPDKKVKPTEKKKKISIKRKFLDNQKATEKTKKETTILTKELELSKHSAFSNIVAAIGFGMSQYQENGKFPVGKCTLKIVIEHE